MFYKKTFDFFRPGEVEEIQKRGTATLHGEIDNLRRRLAAKEKGDLRALQHELVAKEALRKEMEGWDDRKEPYQIRESSRIRDHAKRVGVLAMKGGTLKSKEKDGKCWGDVNGMCPNVAFHEQPFMDKSIGTFFFWDTNTAITAWHCVSEKPWQDLRLMHGFMMLPKGKVQKPTPRQLASAPERVGETDWAILRVKPRQGAATFDPIEFAADSSVSESTYMIGHPMGLPMKVAGNGQVVECDEQHLSVELDAYAQNSGSPVFCQITHLLLGIFVAAEDGLAVVKSGTRKRAESTGQCVVFISRFPQGDPMPSKILRIESLLFPQP